MAVGDQSKRQGGNGRKHPPKLSDFGIIDQYRLRDFYLREKHRRVQSQKWKKIACWIVAAIVFVCVIYSFENLEFPALIAAGWLSFVAFFLAKEAISDDRFLMTLARFAGDQDLAARVRHYEIALQEFRHFSLQTGEGFWRELRDVALEDEAARLFRSEGWRVERTPIVADGGVDLILTGGNRTVWVQCKGHAKPVSVGVVRQIAGACIPSGAEAMLVVSNGLTKPARAEAKALNVAVCDSQSMAALARGEWSFGPNEA